LALDRPGVEPRDPDGRRAGAREEKRHHEGAAAPASPLHRIVPTSPARAQATESTGLDARESTESCSDPHDSIALCSRGPEEARVGPPPAASWLLLIPQIPPRPNYFRVRIGRRLQRLGAVALKNSVYVLPHGEPAREDFEWLAREIVEGGGEA